MVDVVDVEIATQALSDHGDDIVLPLAERLVDDNKLMCIVDPPRNGHVGVHFDDALYWLIDCLAYNLLIYPDGFDLDRVENEMHAFLA